MSAASPRRESGRKAACGNQTVALQYPFLSGQAYSGEISP